MKRSTPMRRTAWPSRAPVSRKAAPPLVGCAESAIKTRVKVGAKMARIGEMPSAATKFPKANLVRSEAYRRLVASMPCIACGGGPCQAAHPNTDKGMAMKTDDRLCFPLCGPQFGRPGCHALFDQGAMFPKVERRAMETSWGADTRSRINAMGSWPKNLPKWSGK